MNLDEAGRQIKQLALESLALDQIQLGLFARADVFMDADHAQGSAIPIPRRDPALIAHPDPMAVAMPHPHLAEIPLRLAGEMTRHLGIGADQILGVTEGPPGLDGRRLQLLQAVAEHLGPARIQHHGVRDEIDFPGADPGRGDDVRETPPLLRQDVFDLLAFRDVAPDRHDGPHGTGGVQHRPVGPLQPTPTPDGLGALLDATGVRGPGERAHGLLGARPILRVNQGQIVPPDQIARIKPKKAAVRRADILVTALGIRADHQILDVLHDQTIPLLLSPQGVLDRALRRDVQGGSGETQGGAVLGKEGPALLPEDARHPIGPQNTVLDGQTAVGTPPGRLPLGTELGQVVGMHGRIEGVQARRDGVRLIPQQTIGFLGPADMTARTIQVPTTELSDGLRLAERGFAAGQAIHGLAETRQILLDANVMGHPALGIRQWRKIQGIPEARPVLAIVANRDPAGLASGQGRPDLEMFRLIAIRALQEPAVLAPDLVRAIAGHCLEALIDEADPKVSGGEPTRDDDPGAGPGERIDEHRMLSSGTQGIEGERRQARRRFQDLPREGVRLGGPKGPDRQDAQPLALGPDDRGAPPARSRRGRAGVRLARVGRGRGQIHDKGPAAGRGRARLPAGSGLAQVALETRRFVLP